MINIYNLKINFKHTKLTPKLLLIILDKLRNTLNLKCIFSNNELIYSFDKFNIAFYTYKKECDLELFGSIRLRGNDMDILFKAEDIILNLIGE